MSGNGFDKFSYLKSLHGVSMTGSQYRVLVTMLDYADADGCNAWPSVETLAADCGMTSRNVKRCQSWLRDNGWIIQRRRGGKRENGQGWSSVYDMGHGDIHGQSGGHSGSVMVTSTVTHGDTGVTQPDPVPSSGTEPQPDPVLDHSPNDQPIQADTVDAAAKWRSRAAQGDDQAIRLVHIWDEATEQRQEAPEKRCGAMPCRNPVTPNSTFFCAEHLSQFGSGRDDDGCSNTDSAGSTQCVPALLADW